MTDATTARESALAEGDDRALLEARERELAELQLPAVIDGVRRTRHLAWDALTTTWEGWDVQAGTRVLLRCVRPRWANDPVMSRRLEQGARHGGLDWRPQGDWPHLRAPFEGSSLHDVLPADEAPDELEAARLVGTALESMDRHHQQGRFFGADVAQSVLLTSGTASLVWLDPFDVERSPAADVRHLSTALAQLDPAGSTTAFRLAVEWANDAPPSASDAARLLVVQLATDLVGQRHRLSMERRSNTRRSRTARLARLVSRLEATLAPPATTVCLRVDDKGLLVIAESDGREVRGGLCASAPTRFLPIVWSADRGLDVSGSRSLLRAWSTRATGDEDHRSSRMRDLGATDQSADQLMRWLASMARLRAARMVAAAMHR